MSPVSANCPTCGAPVAFRLDTTLVTVCEHCSSVVARADRDLESIGRVVDLIETQSPLVLWLDGRFENVGFQLTGRAQIKHGAGGIWDEWYLSFDDGRWGWLAEAQGRYYLTWKVDNPGAVPAFDSLTPGGTANAGGIPFTVVERAEAEMLGARGELPYRLEAGRRFRYADLSGPGGEFATVDYGGESPVVYVGREVTLTDLGLDKAELRDVAAKQVGGLKVACPNCGGSLDLVAPDQTNRVICPYCDTVLDADQGSLTPLKALNVPKVHPGIALGSEGEVGGRRYKVVGFLQRSVEDWGVRYYWDEYLLYEPYTGFRWLTHSNGHWSFIEPLQAGQVEFDPPTDRSARARYDDTRYRVYSHSLAQIEYVSGQFYWKVEPGQNAELADYIAPPYVLSMERTANEINWSRGTYVPREQLEAAFNVQLPTPMGGAVGINQPYAHKGFSKLWKLVVLAAVAVIMLVMMTRSNSTAHTQTFQFEPMDPFNKKPRVQFSEPFTLKSNQNIIVRGVAPVDNSWLFLLCDFVNVDTGLVHDFTMPIEYYHGVSGGERWKEGSKRTTKYVSALPGGNYMLRVSAEWKNFRMPMAVTLEIKQGKVRGKYVGLLLLGLLILPFVMWLHKRSFEKRRWADSTFTSDESE